MNDQVAVICPIYKMYPQIISALICQSHPRWELFLIHNGKEDAGVRKVVAQYADPRIRYSVSPVATGHYGHPLRAQMLRQMKQGQLGGNTDYVLITNADNYYTPKFLETMIAALKKNPSAVAAYCSHMVHSYLDWETQPCWIERGHIDCGGVLFRKNIAANVDWRSFAHSSDWTYFEDILQKHGGKERWIKVTGTLFVHN